MAQKARLDREGSVKPPGGPQRRRKRETEALGSAIEEEQRLDQLAARHAGALPWPVRTLLRGIGAMNPNGGALTSYLLFERDYTRALIELGHADTMARSDEVRQFLCAN